jgi:hypothetical protein
MCVCVVCVWLPQVFPNPNVNYDLNWSLADDDVTPRGDSFRNAPIKVLLQHSAEGKKTSGAGLTAAKAAKTFSVLSTDAGGLDLDAFDAKFAAVGWYWVCWLWSVLLCVWVLARLHATPLPLRVLCVFSRTHYGVHGSVNV